MKKIRGIDVIAITLIFCSTIFLWNGKQEGVMIAILFTVVGHYFKILSDRFGNGKDE